MRLAAKLVLLFLFGLLLIVGLFAYLTIQQDRRLAIAEHERRASDLAATLLPSIEQAVRDQKTGELEQFLTKSTRQVRYMRVRWVEFSADSDRSHRPSVPIDRIVTREVTTLSMRDASGQEYLYTYLPVSDAETDLGSIEIAAPHIGAEKLFRDSLLSSLVALLGVATLSGLVVIVGGIMMVGKPLNELIEKVHRVGDGDFGHPVSLRSHDELGKLGSALNEMCDQLSLQRDQLESEAASRIATVQQLRHAERLNMVGRMAAGIAHEIGTPLNVVTGRAELIASGELDPQATRESAQAIRSEAQRITKIVRELLDFARQSTPHRSQQNLNELIQDTANLMQPLASKQNAELIVNVPDAPLVADVDAGQIQQVLTNLIVNAVQSTDDDGRVTITLSDVMACAEGEIDGQQRPFRRIAICDNGQGISAEDREHIFEPFFTTKDVGEGTGLGLSISHSILQEHEGWDRGRKHAR